MKEYFFQCKVEAVTSLTLNYIDLTKQQRSKLRLLTLALLRSCNAASFLVDCQQTQHSSCRKLFREPTKHKKTLSVSAQHQLSYQFVCQNIVVNFVADTFICYLNWSFWALGIICRGNHNEILVNRQCTIDGVDSP